MKSILLLILLSLNVFAMDSSSVDFNGSYLVNKMEACGKYGLMVYCSADQDISQYQTVFTVEVSGPKENPLVCVDEVKADDRQRLLSRTCFNPADQKTSVQVSGSGIKAKMEDEDQSRYVELRRSGTHYQFKYGQSQRGIHIYVNFEMEKKN